MSDTPIFGIKDAYITVNACDREREAELAADVRRAQKHAERAATENVLSLAKIAELNEEIKDLENRLVRETNVPAARETAIGLKTWVQNHPLVESALAAGLSRSTTGIDSDCQEHVIHFLGQIIDLLGGDMREDNVVPVAVR